MATEEPSAPRTRSFGVTFVRYGIPIVCVIAGLAALLGTGGLDGFEGFILFLGAGLSVLLLNVLHRIGVSGDVDRDREEEARRYFDEHGYWPDQAPRD